MDSVKRALESIGRMWAALKATQKVILSASAAAMVLLLVWGSGSTVPAMVRIAGPEVDAGKRQSILTKFQERNQKHEVRGAEIFVPKEDADRVVTELAGEGAMSDSGESLLAAGDMIRASLLTGNSLKFLSITTLSRKLVL